MTASVLMAWVGGLLVGGAFGALVMALCVAAGRADREGPMAAEWPGREGRLRS